MVSSISGLFFRTLAGLSLSILTKIVLTARRNRRLSTKPVAGIVTLSTFLKPKEDCVTGKTEHFETLPQVGHASTVADHSTSTDHNIKYGTISRSQQVVNVIYGVK